MRYAGVPCSWAERTGRARLSLRRFMFSVTGDRPVDRTHRACVGSPDSYGCYASVETDDWIEARFGDNGDAGGSVLLAVARSKRPKASDPRWPTTCDRCGVPFPRTALRSIDQALEYRRQDTGETITTRNMLDKNAAGMLYDAWWRRFGEEVGDDGIALVAVCPNGHHWHVDAEATGGGRWTRTGDPRVPSTLTVSPSILVSDYHGFLQAGRFTDDLGS